MPPLNIVYAPAGWPGRPRCVSILDSSFNPPHVAHRALLGYEPRPETARLLLLSARNADKTPKAGDPSAAQKLEMVLAMAHDCGIPNTAVALVDEPTFVGKARVLGAYFRGRGVECDLVFMMGHDTLTRFFDPKYYTDMDQALSKFFNEDHASIVSAERSGTHIDKDISKYSAHIRLVKLPEYLNHVSSTHIRSLVKESRRGDQKAKAQLEAWVLPGVRRIIEEHRLYD